MLRRRARWEVLVVLAGTMLACGGQGALIVRNQTEETLAITLRTGSHEETVSLKSGEAKPTASWRGQTLRVQAKGTHCDQTRAFREEEFPSSVGVLEVWPGSMGLRSATWEDRVPDWSEEGLAGLLLAGVVGVAVYVRWSRVRRA